MLVLTTEIMEAQQDDRELQIKRNVEVVMPYYKGTNPAYHTPMITRLKIKTKLPGVSPGE